MSLLNLKSLKNVPMMEVSVRAFMLSFSDLCLKVNESCNSSNFEILALWHSIEKEFDAVGGKSQESQFWTSALNFSPLNLLILFKLGLIIYPNQFKYCPLDLQYLVSAK
jgi:hypothetical protein